MPKIPSILSTTSFRSSSPQNAVAGDRRGSTGSEQYFNRAQADIEVMDVMGMGRFTIGYYSDGNIVITSQVVTIFLVLEGGNTF